MSGQVEDRGIGIPSAAYYVYRFAVDLDRCEVVMVYRQCAARDGRHGHDIEVLEPRLDGMERLGTREDRCVDFLE